MYTQRRFVLPQFILIFFLILSAAAVPTARGQSENEEPPAPVSRSLQRQLATTDEAVSFLVVLRDQLDIGAALDAAPVDLSDRTVRATYLYDRLTAHAQSTQANLRADLAGEGVPVRPFYIVNMLEVTGDAALAARLRSHPAVARLEANPTIRQAHLAMPAASAGPAWLHRVIQPWLQDSSAARVENTRMTTVEQPWGLAYTGAPELWANGITGAEIVVASQDTGVQWDHPALQSRYRGWDGDGEPVDHVYNWYDAWATGSRPAYCDSDPQTPCDDHGHGTHTVGTMLGNATGNEPVLGMAPDAMWIGCRNMENGDGTPASYTACFEFFLAPYPQGGDPMTDGKPELAPHIINNSWGCPPSEGCDAESLRQVVETVRAAGQFVVASAGNYGSNCETVRSPIAIYDATFSIGAHDSTGSIASFSSRGPVTIDGSGRVKPDLAAPGVSVYSSWVNDGYTYLQGTSMASPHVAGGAALLWSAVPTLIGDIDRTEQALIKSATPINATVCNPPGAPPVPNNIFGYGRLNIVRAVEMARLTARLELTARDGTGQPLVNALVTVVDALTGFRSTGVTDANGATVIEPLFAGSYLLDVAGTGGTIPPAPVEIPLGESYGPQVIADGSGPTVTYTVVVSSVMEQLKPAGYLPIISQP